MINDPLIDAICSRSMAHLIELTDGWPTKLQAIMVREWHLRQAQRAQGVIDRVEIRERLGIAAMVAKALGAVDEAFGPDPT